MILALLFTAIYIPIRVAFLDQVAFGMMVFEYIIDVCFALDLFINFFSAFYDDQHSLITDRKTIAKNYLTGWFLIDFMAWYILYLCIVFLFIYSTARTVSQLLSIDYSEYSAWADSLVFSACLTLSECLK